MAGNYRYTIVSFKTNFTYIAVDLTEAHGKYLCNISETSAVIKCAATRASQDLNPAQAGIIFRIFVHRSKIFINLMRWYFLFS